MFIVFLLYPSKIIFHLLILFSIRKPYNWLYKPWKLPKDGEINAKEENVYKPFNNSNDHKYWDTVIDLTEKVLEKRE